MRLLVLSGKGMLGQMVVKYFSNISKYEVCILNDRYSLETHDSYVQKINDLTPHIVVNCLGLIKQRKFPSRALYEINAFLPGLLARDLRSDIILIHPSTDCVFQGDRLDPYKVDEYHDAKDHYGTSKSLGELTLTLRPQTLIIRASIIGPDSRLGGLGLISWFLSHKADETVKGYTNHFWNGITTLEWCNVLEENLVGLSSTSKAKLVQPGTVDQVSKYELLSHINNIYKSKINIVKHKDEFLISRVLEPTYQCPSIYEQLVNLEEFYTC